MPQEAIKIVGLDQARSAFRKLGVPTKAMSTASYEAGLVVLREAEQLVPVRTGRLKQSLKSFKRAKGVTVGASGAKAPYANPIHWGWFRRHILPNPFFVKVLGYKAKDIYEAYFKQLDKAVAETRTNIK